jgi:arylsulfatase A
MQADPGQTTNVASRHPAVRDELSHAFDNWLRDATSGGLDYVPIPIGHPQRPATELPANEAFLMPNTGAGINYISSPGVANAWIVDWTDTQAYPRWHVQVLTPGNYRISLLYNCTAEDVGARVRVAIGDRYVEGQITRAFAPEPFPSPDRLPKEDDHYEEKEWATLEMGTVRLEPGTAELTVRAIRKPGREVMELKAVQIVR